MVLTSNYSVVLASDYTLEIDGNSTRDLTTFGRDPLVLD